MWALILASVKKFGGWILAALVIVGAVLGFAAEEKSKGKLEQQTADSDAIATRTINETNAATQTQVKAVENETKSQADVAALPDGAAAAELLRDWQQPGATVDSAGGAAKAGSD